MTNLEPKTNWRPRVILEPNTTTAVSPRSLAQAVQATVRAVDENALRLVARRDAGLAYQPKTLLALLSYCYARQVYGSAWIENLLRRDENFCQLCHHEFPGARIIRRFRRENREAVQRCLVAALRFLAEQEGAADLGNTANEMQLTDEANRRLEAAMFIDRMELDED